MNRWNDRYYTTTLYYENPGNGIFSYSSNLQSAISYEDYTNPSWKKFVIAIYSLLLFNVIVFAAKIFFELSLGLNRITNTIEVLNLVF